MTVVVVGGAEHPGTEVCSSALHWTGALTKRLSQVSAMMSMNGSPPHHHPLTHDIIRFQTHAPGPDHGSVQRLHVAAAALHGTLFSSASYQTCQPWTFLGTI